MFTPPMAQTIFHSASLTGCTDRRAYFVFVEEAKEIGVDVRVTEMKIGPTRRACPGPCREAYRRHQGLSASVGYRLQVLAERIDRPSPRFRFHRVQTWGAPQLRASSLNRAPIGFGNTAGLSAGSPGVIARGRSKGSREQLSNQKDPRNARNPFLCDLSVTVLSSRRDCSSTRMALTLRPTDLASPVYRDQLDYTVIEDGRQIGRMYEDPNTRLELRWFWSITVFVGSRPDIATHGRTATIEVAKAQFIRNWNRVSGKNRVTRARGSMLTT
jgi:hypothetical protein